MIFYIRILTLLRYWYPTVALSSQNIKEKRVIVSVAVNQSIDYLCPLDTNTFLNSNTCRYGWLKIDYNGAYNRNRFATNFSESGKHLNIFRVAKADAGNYSCLCKPTNSSRSQLSKIFILELRVGGNLFMKFVDQALYVGFALLYHRIFYCWCIIMTIEWFN